MLIYDFLNNPTNVCLWPDDQLWPNVLLWLILKKHSFWSFSAMHQTLCVSTPSAFQIENRKIELNVQSKVGSLVNVKHRPGGGDKKVFNDVDYLKQVNELPGAQLMVKSTSGAPSNASSRRESAVQVWKISKDFYLRLWHVCACVM